MLRLASALARLITKDPNSPVASSPSSPIPKKRSLKSKQTWRSASVHNDGRGQGFKCPFTATNALTVATKKEIEAYTSSEELQSKALSDLALNEESTATQGVACRDMFLVKRASLDVKFEAPASISEIKSAEIAEKTTEIPAASQSLVKKNSLTKPSRKTSCGGGVDRMRGSGTATNLRLDSITLLGDPKNVAALKEKFGTPEKVMHFFGRCFVKFFSNYG